jgi:hypothetical protein
MQYPLLCAPWSRGPSARLHAKHKFTAEEDERLAQLVAKHNESNWNAIAEELGNRNCRQCRERWKNYLDPKLNKEVWTAKEDDLLMGKYEEYGSQWSLIAKFYPSRTDVNCKNRWVVLTNHTTQPKRVRRRSRQEQKRGENQPAWDWNEFEMRQAYDSTELFGFEDPAFTFN